MADASLLASIISGTNPMAPTMLGSYQGAQLQNAALDPNFGHNEGLFGALAKTLAGFSGGNALRQGVQQTTAANQAALPDLAKLLANPDPYTALAGNTAGFDPIAAARLLQGATPEDVAKARLANAQAAFQGARTTNAINQMNAPAVPMYTSDTARAPASSSAPLVGGASSFGAVTAPDAVPDPAQVAKMPPALGAARLRMMSPAAKAKYLQLLQQLQQQGGGNAVRPPT
jgi:hypothetical protein